MFQALELTAINFCCNIQSQWLNVYVRFKPEVNKPLSILRKADELKTN